MTDHDADSTTDAPSASAPETDASATSAAGTAASAGGEGERLSGQRVLRVMEYTALAGLSLLAVIAVIGAYVSASGAIDVWVSGRFKPIFHTVFNLVVLGLVGIGISSIVRRRFDV